MRARGGWFCGWFGGREKLLQASSLSRAKGAISAVDLSGIQTSPNTRRCMQEFYQGVASLGSAPADFER